MYAYVIVDIKACYIHCILYSFVREWEKKGSQKGDTLSVSLISFFDFSKNFLLIHHTKSESAQNENCKLWKGKEEHFSKNCFICSLFTHKMQIRDFCLLMNNIIIIMFVTKVQTQSELGFNLKKIQIFMNFNANLYRTTKTFEIVSSILRLVLSVYEKWDHSFTKQSRNSNC